MESGLAVEADLLRSRVYFASARQQEIQALGQLETARAQLNRLMGNPLGEPVGDTAPLTSNRSPSLPRSLFLAEQKQRRPDYQNLLTELRQAELAVNARQRMPACLGGLYHLGDGQSLVQRLWRDQLGRRHHLALEPVRRGSDAAQLDAARQRLQQKNRQLAAMESAMALEVRRALIQYRAAEQQVLAAQAAEAQSEEGLRILRNRYDAGLATMTDLLSAESARSSARTNLAEAIYRQRLSYAQVEYAAGILSPTSPAINLQWPFRVDRSPARCSLLQCAGCVQKTGLVAASRASKRTHYEIECFDSSTALLGF